MPLPGLFSCQYWVCFLRKLMRNMHTVPRLPKIKQIPEANPSDQPEFSLAHRRTVHSPSHTRPCTCCTAARLLRTARCFSNSRGQVKPVTALQRYLKPLLKGRAPKAVLFLWATAPLEDVITQLRSSKSQFTYKFDIQLVPSACRWLHITQPAVSPPC